MRHILPESIPAYQPPHKIGSMRALFCVDAGQYGQKEMRDGMVNEGEV
jgi:hypothetical protein